jgi:SpoVK/Ycf46/Vps4 family AAA+-type ATPase
VLLAWLLEGQLAHPDREVVRANLNAKLRSALEDKKVRAARGPALGMTPRGRTLLTQIGQTPLNLDLFNAELANADISRTTIQISEPKAGSPEAKKRSELDLALAELDSMEGITEVKRKMHELVALQKVTAAQIARGAKVPPPSLNLIFTGDPGTGKTTVARLVGNIYRALGILKSGHVVEVSQTDLVGKYIGYTTDKTTKVIEKAMDGLLFIDEAYALVNEDAGGYGQEAIDTLVKAMDDNRDRLAVIVAGYTEEMIKFIDSNPGLKSRFTQQFYFENYTTNQLFGIFKKMSDGYEISVAPDVESLVRRHLDVNPTSGANGNGRYVRNMFSMMYQSMAVRAAADGIVEEHEMKEFAPEDVPFSLANQDRPGTVNDVLGELDELVGLESVKSKLREIVAVQKAQLALEEAGLPKITPALNMVFSGPPGTGKTTVARIVARVFQSLGVLGRGQMVETSRPDLIGEYIGRTAPKVASRVKEAIGGVLFIDEAYLLSPRSERDFGGEAIGELITQVENNRGQFSLICAGYGPEMQSFLKSNPGLNSRIDHVVEFPDYSSSELTEIFLSIAKKQKIEVSLEVKAKLDNHFNENETGGVEGNGRYARKLFDRAFATMAIRASDMDDKGQTTYLDAITRFEVSDIPEFINPKPSKKQPMGFVPEKTT